MIVIIVKSICIVSLFIAPSVWGQFSTCDFYQTLELNRVYDVFSPQFPEKFPPNTMCRWTGCAPYGSNIIVNCSIIEVQTSPYCNGDRVEVSYSGCQDLADALRYCSQSFVGQTKTNALVMSLQTTASSNGGRMFCQIEARPTSLPAPQPVTPTRFPNTQMFPVSQQFATPAVPQQNQYGFAYQPVPQQTFQPTNQQVYSPSVQSNINRPIYQPYPSPSFQQGFQQSAYQQSTYQQPLVQRPTYQPAYSQTFQQPGFQQPSQVYSSTFQPSSTGYQSSSQPNYQRQWQQSPQTYQPVYSPSQTVYQPMAPQSQPQCECGLRKQTRIVGGVATDVNEYPFVCGLMDMRTKTVICGGTIISRSFVATAAHCLNNRSISDLGVIVGTTDYANPTESQFAATYRLVGSIIYKDYDSTSLLNDVAILKIFGEIEFNPMVSAICLPISQRMVQNSFVYSQVEAAGYGEMSYGGPVSPRLQKVVLTVIPNNECNQNYPYQITTAQMCTLTPYKDICTFDDGGPIIFVDTLTGRCFLIGIGSYGVACGSRMPRVHTRTSSYVGWIQSITNATFCIV